jgi:hypothetical protein
MILSRAGVDRACGRGSGRIGCFEARMLLRL